MAPHRIRLREPWEVSPTDDSGTVRRCAFHKPTGLAAGDVVRLVIEAAEGLQHVALNDRPQELSQLDGSAICDITAALQPRNHLEFRLVAGGKVGEVRLEIETSPNA
ncbi:MAG: hypothetical protein QM775_36525 [Pirellulales bacterium]